MKYCKACRMEIPAGAKKCPHCGTSQGMSCSGLLGAFLFVIIAGAAIIFFGNNIHKSNEEAARAANNALSEFETEMEEKNYMWANKSKGLIISKDINMHVQSYLTTITGAIQNVGDKNYSYVQVVFSMYDADGAKVGTALGNINNLKAGETWKYEASYFDDDAVKCELDSVDAY